MSRIDRDVKDLERFQEILKILSEEGFGFLLDRADLWSHVPIAKRIKHSREQIPGPVRLRETIERLGPTFIKFGQIMAERPDIVPPKYSEELKKLQDDVPAFDSSEAMQIIDEEIGLDNFEKAQKEPIAAASIAQVHRATLNSGEDVVLKVRRPDIKEKIEKDLDILEFLSKEAEKHFNSMKQAKLMKLVTEFGRWTTNELDLKREMENAEIFRKNLEEYEKIQVPKVWPELSTEKVLTMEYVEGIKPTELENMQDYNIEPEELAEITIEAGFKQVAQDGFFHADPHPSNFKLQKDGTIYYLDFGMIGEVPKDMRDKLTLMFIYAMREEAEELVRTMKDIGYAEDDANLERIKEEAGDKLLRIKNSSISNISITKEFLDLIIFAGQNGLHMPITLSLVGKNLTTMEGIGMEIYPEFRPNDKYKDMGMDILRENNDPEDLSEEIMLDLLENKEELTHPASFLKENIEGMSNSGKGSIPDSIQPNIDIKVLPAALIISSTALIIGSVIDPRLLYIGIAELIIGIFLYFR
jgi:ubiquinone biosynthesis protein